MSLSLRLFGMAWVSHIVAILWPAPAASAASAAIAFPAMVLFMSWLRPAAGFGLGFEKLLDSTKGCGDEGNFSEEISLEDSEGNDTEEERDESSELKLDQGKNGQELLQLLLLLATPWKQIQEIVRLMASYKIRSCMYNRQFDGKWADL